MRNLTLAESLKIESINLTFFRVPANSKTKELHQREFEWFVGKGRELPGKLTSEFFAYLTIQISPEIFARSLDFYELPHYFEGKRIRKNLRTLSRAPHFNSTTNI